MENAMNAAPTAPQSTFHTARVVLALPAYNESANIDPLFERIAAVRKNQMHNLSVLLYDDGSTDDTKARATAWNGRTGLSVRVIGRPENRGLGVALESLVRDFSGPQKGGQPESEAMALMDCDDTMDPLQIPEMWERMQAEELDLVIASRFRRGGMVRGVPFSRRIMSRGATLLFSLLHPIKGVRDYSCGYRLYRRALLEKACQMWREKLLEESGFASMVELLIKLKQLEARAREIPLRLRYDRKRGASKMPVSDNAVRLLKLMWKWRIRGVDPPEP